LSDHVKLVQLRDAAKVLGISYSTLKRWIHTRKIQTVKTQGGHHRIPEGARHFLNVAPSFEESARVTS
jgi:excisionase family DNA binding protein